MSDNTHTTGSPGSSGSTRTEGEEAAREAGTDMKDAAQRSAASASQAAQQAAGQARDAARDGADRAKESVADEMSGIASALRTAASEMRDGSPQERTFGQIAESLADASEAVRDRDLGQIAGDLSDFARRNPLVFLGGAALAGFAATRFAKASQSAPSGGYAGQSRSGTSMSGTSSGSGASGDYGSRAGGISDAAARSRMGGEDPTNYGTPDPTLDVDRGAIPEPATSAVPASPGGTAPRATTQPPATQSPALKSGSVTGDKT